MEGPASPGEAQEAARGLEQVSRAEGMDMIEQTLRSRRGSIGGAALQRSRNIVIRLAVLRRFLRCGSGSLIITALLCRDWVFLSSLRCIRHSR